jgi:hypothetical protein
MSTAGLLARLRVTGLTVATDGDSLTVRPRELLTDEQREAIRANKSAILAELEHERRDDPATEARRQRVLALLALHPDWRYAVITDDHSDPDTTTVHIGMRGIGTGEVVMARARYEANGTELIRLLDQHAKETDTSTRPTLP